MPERTMEQNAAAVKRPARNPEPAPHASIRAPAPAWDAAGARAPGAPSAVLAIQRAAGNQAVMRMLDASRPGHPLAGPATALQRLSEDELDDDIQLAAVDLHEPSDDAIRSAAAEGVRTPSVPLPHLDRIQASFGRHSIAHVQAHVGPEAARASRAMNALAYASGDHVVFGTTPDLRTAAHEAAHIVQQQAGVQLSGGIGRAGDPYERHADAVADAVVAGRSAAWLFRSFVHAETKQKSDLIPARTTSLERPSKVAEPDTGSEAMGLGRANATTPDHLPQARNLEVVQMMKYHFVSDPNGSPFRLTTAELRALIDKDPNAIKSFRTGRPNRNEKKQQGTLYLEADNKYEDEKNTGWIKNAMERRTNKGETPQRMFTYGYWENKLKDRNAATLHKTYASSEKASSTGSPHDLEWILRNAPTLLSELAKQAKKSSGRLRLYRTMKTSDAKAILEWYALRKKTTEALLSKKWDPGEVNLASRFHQEEKANKIGVIPVTGHLGDIEQARNYLLKDPTNRKDKTMLEFTIKPGAHNKLFTPDYMTLGPLGGTTRLMNEYTKLETGTEFPTTADSEAYRAGYIGVKSEEHGPFSIAISNSNATQLLFQLFVESIRELGATEAEGSIGKATDSTRTETQKSGNCLYEAVNILLGNDPEMDAILRAMTTNIFLDNTHLATDAAIETDRVVETLSTVGGWAGNAGDLAPIMLASAIGRTLRIVMRNAVYIIEPLNPPQESGLTLYLDNNHYTVEPTFTVDTDTLPQKPMKFPEKPG